MDQSVPTNRGVSGPAPFDCQRGLVERQERAKQDSRALTIRLQEQKHLNSDAIKAKLKGELLQEDVDALKQSITEEIALIEKQLSALESERSTMDELIAQTQRELIDPPAAWGKAGLSERRELFTMLFPAGLVYSHEWGFLNSQNETIMQDLRASWLDADDLDKFGVPDYSEFEHLGRRDGDGRGIVCGSRIH
jgi:hypothetical protein